MKEVGIGQAKTRFSEIARQVKSTGKSVRVVSRGKPVVEIIPAQSIDSDRPSRHEVIGEMNKLRTRLAKSSLAQIRKDIAEGRR